MIICFFKLLKKREYGSFLRSLYEVINIIVVFVYEIEVKEVLRKKVVKLYFLDVVF